MPTLEANPATQFLGVGLAGRLLYSVQRLRQFEWPAAEALGCCVGDDVLQQREARGESIGP